MNLHTIQPDEQSLILHQRAPPSGCHLCNSIDATDQNSRICHGNGNHHAFEIHGPSQLRCGRVQLGAELVHSEGIFGGHDAENDESNHLEGHTKDHDIVARIDVHTPRGNTSANGLDGDGDDIEGNEEPGVELGSDAGEGCTKDDNPSTISVRHVVQLGVFGTLDWIWVIQDEIRGESITCASE